MSKRPVSIEEMKKIEFDMLVYLDEVCEKNNLDYYLAAGTLLGAVRHQGFIPWDDDIDIELPRNDFDKLLNLIERDGKYNLVSPYKDDCYYPFAKICDKRTKLIENNYPEMEQMGVYIDIFPLDNYPEEYEDRKRYTYRLNRIWYNLVACYEITTSINRNVNLIKYCKRRIKVFLCKLLNQGYWRKKLHNEMIKYNDVETGYVGFGFTQYLGRFIHRSEYFNETVMVKFEGSLFHAPKMYKEYLTDLYGDYLKLPPIEKRVPHHEFEAFWVE